MLINILLYSKNLNIVKITLESINIKWYNIDKLMKQLK